MSAKQRLFNATRSYSQLLVGVAVILSLFFTAFIGSDNLNWQISLAVIALIIGIPHGALDHLVTLPKDKPAKMALFVIIYVLIAVAAVWAILQWNVLGFQLVVIMSAAHFGIGDAAFIAESERLNNGVSKSLTDRLIYALPAGLLPVFVPLTSDLTNSALSEVNPKLINWAGSNSNLIHLLVLLIAASSLFILILKRDDKSAMDLTLLAALSILTPPLVAFAIYFGLWHALRHTARLTLNLSKSEIAYQNNEPKRAFINAVIPGIPALIGTFIVAAVLAATNPDNSRLLWSILVVIWALTVPHMMVTAKLDKGALLGK
jgi:Brp/Blh family beta-carotene 15,15'-monooxygenase